MATFVFLLLFVQAVVAQPEDSKPSATALNGQVELARLVDLCAQRLGMKIEYDNAALKGAVTLRLGQSLTDQELWNLTNRILAARGFTSVQLAGADSKTVSIVKVADAPGMANVEGLKGQEQGTSGYVSVVTRVEHQPAKGIVDALKQIVSKPGGSVSDLGSGNLILISDLRPRVDEALRLIQVLDVEGTQPLIQKVNTRYISASQLAPLIASAAAAAESMSSGAPRKGKVIATPEADSLMLICPPAEQEYWARLIEQLDQRQAVATQYFPVKHFGTAEIAKLIEQAARDTSPRGAGEQWKVVSDDLTGTLIVTATAPELEKVKETIARLDSLPAESRRPMRVFVLRNRSVREITDVINKLLDAGVLDAANAESATADSLRAPAAGAPTPQAAPVSITTRGASSESTTTLQSSSPSKATLDTSLNRRSASNSSVVSSAVGTGSGGKAVTMTADEGTNSVIATADARVLNQLEDLIRKLDVRQSQVMIEVLSRSLKRLHAHGLVEVKRHKQQHFYSLSTALEMTCRDGWVELNAKAADGGKVTLVLPIPKALVR